MHVFLRPGTILGEDTHNQITAIFDRPAVLGLHDKATPFVFVLDEDVARIVAVGVRDHREGVFNLVGDGVMTLREIAGELGKPFVPLPAATLRRGFF